MLTVGYSTYFSYLELALLPCWRFLCDQPVVVTQRLVMMTRGLADPLASAYCRLYLTHCAQKLPLCDVGMSYSQLIFTYLLLEGVIITYSCVVLLPFS